MAGYTIPRATLQQVLQRHESEEAHRNTHVQNVMHRLKTCRTAAMGYHAYRCGDEACGYVKYQYIAAATGTAQIVALLKNRSG